jgi:pilus assembly protein CpaC
MQHHCHRVARVPGAAQLGPGPAQPDLSRGIQFLRDTGLPPDDLQGNIPCHLRRQRRVIGRVVEDREIQTRVEVEVSNVDESISVLGIPGFAVRNAATEMRGRSGETLLIAGLIDGQQSEAVSQLPGLGDLPILGTLFKSRRFQRDETELVVLITPYIEGETDTPTASKASLTKPSNPRPSDNSDSRLPLEGFPP